MKKANLGDLSLERLIGTEGRVLSKSSSVNKFLNKDFKLPSTMKNLEEWTKKQYSGVANTDYVKELVDEIVGRDIEKEVTKVTEELNAHTLTDTQSALVPDAIKGYRKFLVDGVAKSKRVLEVVDKVNEKVAKVKAVVDEVVKPKEQPKEKATNKKEELAEQD
jgi:hypothetical protein